MGFTNYSECRYFKGDFLSKNMRYIQEATLDYLQTKEKWSENDIAYILLTSGAKKINWIDTVINNSNSQETSTRKGLKSCLEQKGYSFQVKPIEGLPNGDNENELFEIFRIVFDVLEQGDSLYFDITHGFRSLPMLAMVLINYSKFLKDIEVKSITYGNFEARKTITCADGSSYLKAPIIDLLPISDIQDWTFAAADFLKNGNADRFSELSCSYRNSVFKGIVSGDKNEAITLDKLINCLKNVVDDFQTCRGHNILSSSNLSKLKDYLEKINKTVIEPLNPVIQKMEDAFVHFEKPNNGPYNVNNGMEAAKWCIDNNLYQQAATIMQECIVTYFCIKYDLDFVNEEERKLVNGAFAKYRILKSQKTNEQKKELIRHEIDNNDNLKRLCNDNLLTQKEVYENFCLLTDERNDINHSGMRNQPLEANTIRGNIRKAFVFSINYSEILSHEKSSYHICWWPAHTRLYWNKGRRAS